MSRKSIPRRARALAPALVAAAATLTAIPAESASTVLCPGHWKKVANDGPPARGGHAMAYDPQRQRVVLFGGTDAHGPTRLGDTWEWNGTQWTLGADTGPSGRSSPSLVYDAVRQRILMFGGTGRANDYYGDNDDSWEWDGAGWTDVTAADPDKRPSQRNGQGMAYDLLRQKTVLYGGSRTFDGEFHDTWTRDDGNWRRRAKAGGPPEQNLYGAMSYHRELGLSVILTEPCQTPDTWTFDGDGWSVVTGARPTPRYAAPTTYDSARHRTVLHGGGACNRARPTDTWEWDGTDWQQVADGGPGERDVGSAMAYDRRRGEVVLFGGAHEGHVQTHDTWIWKGPTYRCDVATPGDINCDGVVDIDDRKIVDSGRGTPACAPDDTRDLDGDGRITLADKAALAALCNFADCARYPGDEDRD